jgi:DNA-binding transcriptional ArsR family regulator
MEHMKVQPPLLAPIFRSDAQLRLLAALLIDNPELSISDLAERVSIAYATTHGEVSRLLAAGVLRERQVGRSRVISGNPESPLFSPLREILLVVAGPVALLSEAFGKIDGVERAFIYGSFAARARGVDGSAPNDIDLMVVGTPDASAVYEVCRAVEKSVARPINPTILTPDEFAAQSGFLESVRSNPILPIIGGDL